MEVSEALEAIPASLLRRNGQVAVGRMIPEAVMMAIYLEEAADLLYGALRLENRFSSQRKSPPQEAQGSSHLWTWGGPGTTTRTKLKEEKGSKSLSAAPFSFTKEPDGQVFEAKALDE